jgi:hypothetical protein
MKWFLETTVFTGASAPNHVYLLNDSKSKMYAYRPFGTGAVQTFKQPISIDLRGRKFVVNPEQYATKIKEEKPAGRTWTVKGSKGDEYRVTEHSGNLSCNCTGFRFRGDCKHVKDPGIR